MSTNHKATSLAISHSNIYDAVADRIREMILNGQLKPGDRLQQDKLADLLGVSTMPVREALRRLQAEGLVIFYPRRGATVAKFSFAEFEEIYRIREELEILACRWVAEDFSRLPTVHLRQVLVQIEEAEAQLDVLRRLQLVREFFFTIFETSKKPYLVRQLSTLWDLSQQYRRSFSAIFDTVPTRLEYYWSVYQACEAQDQEALIKAFRELYAFVRSTLTPRLLETG